jgi:hypothetical protein
VLDGHLVECIGDDLREPKSAWKPVKLGERHGQSFKGVDFGGTGFLLSSQQRDAILETSPREQSFIWPVLNANTFTSSPDLKPTGYIINFTEKSLVEAEAVTQCMGVVKALVLPKRRKDKRKAYRERWWIYNEARSGMYAAIASMSRVLIGPVVSKYISFGFCEPRVVFTNAVNVFIFESVSAFSIMQSTVHQVWAIRARAYDEFLDLNQQRAEQARLAGPATTSKPKKKPAKKKAKRASKKQPAAPQSDLFADGDEG